MTEPLQDPTVATAEEVRLFSENARLRTEIEERQANLVSLKAAIETQVKEQQMMASQASEEASQPAEEASQPAEEASQPAEEVVRVHKGLIFVKTYKTASTTIAMILNSVAAHLNLQALHPLDKGWFQESELKTRAANGNSFDLSYRHLTPVVEYDALRGIVPDAFLTTVVRDPATKFVSMFNFVETTKKQFGTPANFVTSGVVNAEATDQQINDLCNNMAYTLSGEKKVLGRMSLAESEEYARNMIADLESRNMFVMVMERLDESFVVVCDNMGWDCYGDQHVPIKNTRERSQGGAKVGCTGDCLDVIRTCNHVDYALYKYFDKKLDEIVKGIAGFEEKLKKVKEHMASSSNGAHKYPVNCKKDVKHDWERLHTCESKAHSLK